MSEVDHLVLARLAQESDAIVARYKDNYGIGAEEPVTDAMVRKHWQLERALAHALLSSTPATRASVFEDAYTRLYRECDWLNRLRPSDNDSAAFLPFLKQLRGARTIYEVGSGKGHLARFLSAHGIHCVATEITAERGKKLSQGSDGIAWHASDGIHLAAYEPPSHYDAVISSQVIEHLHPDDLPEHLRNVLAILKPGGAYVFNTPNALNGPADLSRIFGLHKAFCMHLKEYTYGELLSVLRATGFHSIKAVYAPPHKIARLVDFSFSSSAYLWLCTLTEKIAQALPATLRRLFLKLLYCAALWRPDIFIRAEKSASRAEAPLAA
jgi:2-polyprenyl-3-methyl-5-hydroxy-6-metoxy-1,4-benzoquinol methylase